MSDKPLPHTEAPTPKQPKKKLKSGAPILGWISLILSLLALFVLAEQPRTSSDIVLGLLFFLGFSPILVFILSLVGIAVANSAVKKAKAQGYEKKAIRPLKLGRTMPIIAFIFNFLPLIGLADMLIN